MGFASGSGAKLGLESALADALVLGPAAVLVVKVGASVAESGRIASRADPTPSRKINATPITTPKNTTGASLKMETKHAPIRKNARRMEAGRNLATCTAVSKPGRPEVPARVRKAERRREAYGRALNQL